LPFVDFSHKWRLIIGKNRRVAFTKGVYKVRKTISILFALVLALGLCLMTAVPVSAQSANFVPNTGPVGTTIAVTGAGWAAGEAINSATVGGVVAVDTLVVDGGGALTGDIIVPTVGLGAQDIVITGAVSGAQTFVGAFTVTDATAIFVPIAGPAGTTIAVTGAGWVASDTIAVGAVTVGSVVATHTLVVDGAGALTGNIVVPAQAAGLKDIVITGTTSGAQTFVGAFTVTDATAIFVPIAGPAGFTIAVTGAGWVASDTIAVGAVTVGGVVATHTLVVDGAGALTGNVIVPIVAGGLKDIVITGTTSGAQTFVGAFTVTTIDHYAVSAIVSPVGATVPFTVIIQARDAFNNNITVGPEAAENITITLGKPDAGATPTSTATVAGVAAVSMTMTVPQTFGQSITFTGVTSGKTGTSMLFDVAVVSGGGGAPSPSGEGFVNISYFLDPAGRATVVITLTSTNGLVTMNIPSGTLVLDAQGNPLTNIQIVVLSTPPPPPGYVLVGRAYDCLPDGATFQPAMTLTFRYYEPSVPRGANEQDLVLAYWDGEQWVNLPTTVDAVANTATVEVTHFTPFALLIEVPQEEAPPEGAPPEETPPEGTSPEAEPLNIWIVVGIIAAVIVLGLIIFMLVRRRA